MNAVIAVTEAEVERLADEPETINVPEAQRDEWERAARLLATRNEELQRERDEFRESALMYAAEVAELRAALPPDEEGNRQYGRLMPNGRVIPSATPDPTHYRLTGPWMPMSQPEPPADKPLITSAPELAAAYGLEWPANACPSCGGAIYDGQCYGAEQCEDPTCTRDCCASQRQGPVAVQQPGRGAS